MGDTFTETTHKSWFSRIGSSIKGFLLGWLLLIVGICLLFWNEGRAIKTHNALAEAQGQVVSINSSEAAPQINSLLVHISGHAISNQTLTDDLLPVSVQALKLERQVETYQWEEREHREEKKTMGGDMEIVTTYTYEKTWSGEQIDSSQFKKPNGHQNPSGWRYQDRRLTADVISIGPYQLSNAHKDKIRNFKRLNMPDTGALPDGVVKNSAGFYYGKDEREPRIGDQQITFRYIPAQTYSAIGDLSGQTLIPHIASNGREIALLDEGTKTADAMFESAKSGNRLTTWLIRLAGCALLILAFNMILRPLSVLADIAPLFGNILEVGIGIVSFLLGLALALIVISIAWIFYRPLVGILLCAIAAGAIYLLKQKSNKAKRTSERRTINESIGTTS